MDLRLDQALVTAQNLDPSLAVSIWSQVEECENCSLVYQTTINPSSSKSIIVDTRYRVTLEVRDANGSPNSTTFCKIPFRWFTDHAVYQLNITSDGTGSDCKISTLKSGRNNLIPIYLAIAFYVLLSVGWFIYRRKFSTRRVDTTEQTSRQRLKSLDAFRGLTMIMMIFVNYGSAGYAFLDHAPWFGLTIADVIFPWFIFIMGH